MAHRLARWRRADDGSLPTRLSRRQSTGGMYFYAWQHICYSAYTLSPVRPSVCPSHRWISQKRLKLALRNFHHTVVPSLQFFDSKFHPEILKFRPGRRPLLDGRRCRLSLSVVVVEIRCLLYEATRLRCPCPGVCLSAYSVLASGYGYSCTTSVPAILLRLSQRPCPGVSVPVSCPLLPVPGFGNVNSVIKEIKIQTFCDR